jgi:hypothetical protein
MWEIWILSPFCWSFVLFKVISRGFSTLFTLHKADLNEQLKDFPEAGKILRRKAKWKNEKRK